MEKGGREMVIQSSYEGMENDLYGIEEQTHVHVYSGERTTEPRIIDFA